MLTGFKWLATAGFGAAYLLLVFLAAHPRVDAEYAAHFLRRATDCWLPRELHAVDAPSPASVEVGRLSYPEACRYLRLNWHSLEDWGAWAGSKQAILRLPWKPGMSAVELTVRGAPAPGPSIAVRFVLNGQATMEEIPPGTLQTITFPLPADLERHTPDMRLSFSNHAAVPGPPPKRTTREAGIGLVAIRYLPGPPAADEAAAAPEASAVADTPR